MENVDINMAFMIHSVYCCRQESQTHDYCYFESINTFLRLCGRHSDYLRDVSLISKLYKYMNKAKLTY